MRACRSTSSLLLCAGEQGVASGNRVAHSWSCLGVSDTSMFASSDGAQLTNDAGETTSHLMGFFYRTIRMIEGYVLVCVCVYVCVCVCLCVYVCGSPLVCTMQRHQASVCFRWETPKDEEWRAGEAH